MTMTDAQRHLFRIPQTMEFNLTMTQRRVLDWVAYNEGRAGAIYPVTQSRYSLRSLIKRKLVECVAHSPARYRLTELGRMVRGQLPVARKQEALAFARALEFED